MKLCSPAPSLDTFPSPTKGKTYRNSGKQKPKKKLKEKLNIKEIKNIVKTFFISLELGFKDI